MFCNKKGHKGVTRYTGLEASGIRPYIRSVLVSWTQTQSNDLIHLHGYDNGLYHGMLDKRKQPYAEFYTCETFLPSAPRAS